MADRPLYQELRRVFLDSWSDANGWASMLRMIADREETDPATAAWLRAEAERAHKKQPAKLSLLQVARESLRISAARGDKPKPIDAASSLAVWDRLANGEEAQHE